MEIQDLINEQNIYNMRHGGDPLMEYLARKRQLEDEARIRGYNALDLDRKFAQQKELQSASFAQQSQMEKERIAAESEAITKRARASQRLDLEKQANALKIPVVDNKGAARSDADILADIEDTTNRKNVTALRGIDSQIAQKAAVINSFSENPNIDAVRRAALQSIANDPSLISQMPTDVAAQLKAVAAGGGDLGMLLAKLRSGPFGGINQSGHTISNADYANKIEAAFGAQLANLSALSKDESVRKYAASTREALADMQMLSALKAKTLGQMSPDALTSYFGSSGPANASTGPTPDRAGLVLPGAGKGLPGPSDASARASGLQPLSLPPTSSDDIQAMARYVGGAPAPKVSMANLFDPQQRMMQHYGTTDLSWTPEDTQGVMSIAKSQGISDDQLSNLYKAAMVPDISGAQARQQFIKWRDQARAQKSVLNQWQNASAYPSAVSTYASLAPIAAADAAPMVTTPAIDPRAASLTPLASIGQ